MYQSSSYVWSSLIAIVETENGYLIGGATGNPLNDNWHQITLSVLNKNGEKIDEKIIGDTISEYYIAKNSFYKTIDDEVVFSGSRSTYYQDFPHDEVLIIKLDESYDTVWTKYFGEKTNPWDTSYVARQLIITSYSKIANTGWITPESNYKDQTYLMLTDSIGNLLWERFYGYPNPNYKLRGFSVIETPDKGFALGAYRFKPGYAYTGEPMVYKVDSLGNEQWHVDVGSPYFDDRTLLCTAHDGNIIAATCSADSMSGSDDAYRRVNIIKLDLEGNTIWDYKYGHSRLYHYIGNIQQTNDGGYIVTGSMATASLSGVPPWESGWVFKINGEGDSLWYRFKYNLASSYDENFLYDIIPTNDNGFAACGQVFGPTTGYTQHAWVVKMDSMGCDTPGCFTTSIPEISPSGGGQGEELLIWPNPTKNKFEVWSLPAGPLGSKFGVGNSNLIRVYNSQGIMMEEIKVPEGIESLEIDVSTYTNGLYYLQYLQSNQIAGFGKFIKN